MEVGTPTAFEIKKPPEQNSVYWLGVTHGQKGGVAPTRGLARVDQGGMCGLALVPLPLSPARGGLLATVLSQF